MILVCTGRLEKSDRAGEVDVPVIMGVESTIEAGAFVSFVGLSGSSKACSLRARPGRAGKSE